MRSTSWMTLGLALLVTTTTSAQAAPHGGAAPGPAQQDPAPPATQPGNALAPVPGPSVVAPAAAPSAVAPAAPTAEPAGAEVLPLPAASTAGPGAAPASAPDDPATDVHPEGEPPKPDDAADEPGWPVLTFHARVLTGVELERFHPDNGQSVADETEPGFFLEQAVVEVEAELSKRLELEVGFNLRSVGIRDAFLNYRFDDAFQLRAGRFKRPFSRLQLRSRGRIPFRDRGPFNDLLTDNQFAGRGLGGMLWGEPIPTLRYFLAVMDPAELGTGIEGADLIGRVVFDPNSAWSFGISAIHKWTERFADGPNISLHGVGGDVKLEVGAFEVTVEADAFQNPNPPPVSGGAAPAGRTPWAVGVIGYSTYTFKLSKKWTMEPVLVLEWFDPDTEYSKDAGVRAVAGFSWNYRKNALRIMPQVELLRPTGGADVRGQIASETYYLMLAVEI